MLKRFAVRGFKSLRDVEVHFPKMAVLFGPNAAGKSNLLDAIQALSRVATERTLADALGPPIRGYPIEAFMFPGRGLEELLKASMAAYTLEADLGCKSTDFRYRIEVRISPESGSLSVGDEYLARLGKEGLPKGPAPIEQVDGKLRLRRKNEGGKPRFEDLGLNYALMSDARYAAPTYAAIEETRAELSGWRTYYLDPRVAMRSAVPPSDARDIGVLGGEIAPYLYRLKAEHPKRFDAIRRTVRAVIPSVEDVTVDLDQRRGTLDILVRQGGLDYSSRIVSEGTLRVLALCAIAVNPWSKSLVAFEEPENGVHPRRIELIAQLLLSLSLEHDRQVVITTHSPLFCDAVLKAARSRPDEIGLFNVRRENDATTVRPFDTAGPLFQDKEVAAALTAGTEDGLFESLLLRGLLDD